jgi:hypothetical protein
MEFSLVALDTDHIKDYVFGTDKLKEIRGASSLLDRLNRNVMRKLAEEAGGRDWREIYANGGSGLFLIDSAKAVEFTIRVQHEYRQQTAGGASVTCVVQSLPADAPHDIESIMTYPMPNTLALLRYRLREQKDHPHTSIEQKDQLHAFINEVSHPLMRPCDSCGTHYAVKQASDAIEFYCQVCLNKQAEDRDVKDYIKTWIRQQKPQKEFESPLWNEVLERLQRYNYSLSDDPGRPEDLNVFSEFRQAKDYLGLIYADANGMGRAIEKLKTLHEIQVFAKKIDEAVYWAMCDVISDRLPAKQLGEETWIFPFDILLIGGDDIVLVTPAAQAMPIAYALAKRFYTLTNGEQEQDNREHAETYSPTIKNEEKERKDKDKETHSLSVAVVLAPTNYPFSLMRHLAEDALKFAKKDGSKTFATKESKYGKTRVNFLVVSGSTSQDFGKVYKQLHREDEASQRSFYATVRPYTLEQLEFLLAMLQEGSRLALGRSKLHQLREAILQLNLSTSVTGSLAVLRTWREEERNFVVKEVYSTQGKYPLSQWDEQNPTALFPVVTFPWFVENKEESTKRYTTLLLDFVELYDFVAREVGDEHDQD